MVVKNWPNDSRLNCTPILAFQNYMKIEYSLVEENCDLIEKINFFEELQVDDN
jgi:hypothetical protein